MKISKRTDAEWLEILVVLKERGQCKDETERMFPTASGTSKEVVEAKAICRRCPVQAMCGEYALANNERFGVWGGMSETERKRIRRRMKKAG